VIYAEATIDERTREVEVELTLPKAEAYQLRLELMGAISYLESFGVLKSEEDGPTIRALERALATLHLASI
jgi:hypothetical protein